MIHTTTVREPKYLPYIIQETAIISQSGGTHEEDTYEERGRVKETTIRG